MSETGNDQTEKKKKAYSSPVIRFYGAIRTITEDIGNKTRADNGTAPKVRTA